MIKYYATFDADGFPAAFFNDGVFPDVVEFGPVPAPTEADPAPVAPELSRTRNPKIPAAAVSITHAQWRELIDNQGGRRWGGEGVVAYAPPPPLIDLMAYAAAVHTACRDGGVTIGGMLVKTDAESRGLINGAYALIEVRPDASIDFKASSGWVTLDAATMRAIAVAVGTWVQLCYTAYRAVSDGIASGDITASAQIDALFAAVRLPG